MKILAEGGKGSNGKGEALTRLVGRPARWLWGSRLTALVGLGRCRGLVGTPPQYNWATTDMFILLNGSFGIGNTTVARELRSALPGSAIFDPEPIGLLVMRLSLRRVSDFQHLTQWRRSTILGARVVATYRSTVIIPMTFSESGYLDEVRNGLALTGQPVHHFCLTAPLQVVQQRLAGRGEAVDDPKFAWVHRRAIECVAAHRSSNFRVHLETESRTPAAIAADIAVRLGSTVE